jgi:hypothetical protein
MDYYLYILSLGYDDTNVTFCLTETENNIVKQSELIEKKGEGKRKDCDTFYCVTNAGFNCSPDWSFATDVELICTIKVKLTPQEAESINDNYYAKNIVIAIRNDGIKS